MVCVCVVRKERERERDNEEPARDIHIYLHVSFASCTPCAVRLASGERERRSSRKYILPGNEKKKKMYTPACVMCTPLMRGRW